MSRPPRLGSTRRLRSASGLNSVRLRDGFPPALTHSTQQASQRSALRPRSAHGTFLTTRASIVGATQPARSSEPEKAKSAESAHLQTIAAPLILPEAALLTRGCMRNRGLIGLAITATVACCFIEASQTNGIIGYYREALPPAKYATWVAGLLIAIMAPPTCSVLFWLIATRSQHGWVAHLLLVPVTFIAFQVAASVMLTASGEPDLDSLTGYALLPAMLLFVVCLVGYLVGLVTRSVCRRWGLANGS
jgi:hypothetical protein